MLARESFLTLPKNPRLLNAPTFNCLIDFGVSFCLYLVDGSVKLWIWMLPGLEIGLVAFPLESDIRVVSL